MPIVLQRCAAALAAVFLLGGQAEAAKLPSYNVDLDQTSVSGISSGGFMSVQLHLAYSSIISGVGVFAGGPYDCARDSVNRALETCMGGKADAAMSIERTRVLARNGAIDDPANGQTLCEPHHDEKTEADRRRGIARRRRQRQQL